MVDIPKDSIVKLERLFEQFGMDLTDHTAGVPDEQFLQAVGKGIIKLEEGLKIEGSDGLNTQVNRDVIEAKLSAQFDDFKFQFLKIDLSFDDSLSDGTKSLLSEKGISEGEFRGMVALSNDLDGYMEALRDVEVYVKASTQEMQADITQDVPALNKNFATAIEPSDDEPKEVVSAEIQEEQVIKEVEILLSELAAQLDEKIKENSFGLESKKIITPEIIDGTFDAQSQQSLQQILNAMRHAKFLDIPLMDGEDNNFVYSEALGAEMLRRLSDPDAKPEVKKAYEDLQNIPAFIDDGVTYKGAAAVFARLDYLKKRDVFTHAVVAESVIPQLSDLQRNILQFVVGFLGKSFPKLLPFIDNSLRKITGNGLLDLVPDLKGMEGISEQLNDLPVDAEKPMNARPNVVVHDMQISKEPDVTHDANVANNAQQKRVEMADLQLGDYAAMQDSLELMMYNKVTSAIAERPESDSGIQFAAFKQTLNQLAAGETLTDEEQRISGEIQGIVPDEYALYRLEYYPQEAADVLITGPRVFADTLSVNSSGEGVNFYMFSARDESAPNTYFVTDIGAEMQKYAALTPEEKAKYKSDNLSIEKDFPNLTAVALQYTGPFTCGDDTFYSDPFELADEYKAVYNKALATPPWNPSGEVVRSFTLAASAESDPPWLEKKVDIKPEVPSLP